MDERYLLAAVLMVIGLQLGKSKIIKLMDCKNDNELVGWEMMEDTVYTNTELMATTTINSHSEQLMCAWECLKTPGCRIATLEGDRVCTTYKYQDFASSSFQLPQPVSGSGVSYKRVAGSQYKFIDEPGPWNFNAALARCAQDNKILPKLNTTQKFQDFRHLLADEGKRPDNTDTSLVWLYADRSNANDDFSWIDDRELVQPTKSECSNPGEYWTCDGHFWFLQANADSTAVQIQAPSLKFYMGAVEAKPSDNVLLETVTTLICQG